MGQCKGPCDPWRLSALWKCTARYEAGLQILVQALLGRPPRQRRPPLHFYTIAPLRLYASSQHLHGSTLLLPIMDPPYPHKEMAPLRTRPLIPNVHFMDVSFSRQFPPEVQEKFIDRLCDDVFSLRRCSLTCRDWHVRARFHIFGRHIHIRDRKQVEEISTYLRAHPYLGALVLSVRFAHSIHPYRVSHIFCTSLLKQVPNLRRCEFRGGILHASNLLSFHPCTLTYLKAHSSVEILCLSDVLIPNFPMLSRLISSMPRLIHLTLRRIGLAQMNKGQDVQVVESAPAYYWRNATKLRHLEVRVEAQS